MTAERQADGRGRPECEDGCCTSYPVGVPELTDPCEFCDVPIGEHTVTELRSCEADLANERAHG